VCIFYTKFYFIGNEKEHHYMVLFYESAHHSYIVNVCESWTIKCFER